MNELLAFVRACLDREEQVTRAVPRDAWLAITLYRDRGEVSTRPDGHQVARTPDHRTAEHIAMQDPAHTLARIESDRKILDALADTLSTSSPYFTVESCDELDAILAERITRMLAQRYAGWDGWREEWRA